MHYTKPKPGGRPGELYHGHDRSDAEPGFYHVPDWQLRAILRAIKAGEMTYREIAKQFNVHERSVTRYARMAGVPPKTGVFNYPEETRAGVYQDYVNSQLTLLLICKKYGLPTSSHGGGARDIALRWAKSKNLPFRQRLRWGGQKPGAARGVREVCWGPWKNCSQTPQP